MTVKPAAPVPMLVAPQSILSVWAVTWAGFVPPSPQIRISQGDLHGGAASGRGCSGTTAEHFSPVVAIYRGSLASGCCVGSLQIQAASCCPCASSAQMLQMGSCPSLWFGNTGPGLWARAWKPLALLHSLLRSHLGCGKRHLMPSQHCLWGNWEACSFAKAFCPSRHP